MTRTVAVQIIILLIAAGMSPIHPSSRNRPRCHAPSQRKRTTKPWLLLLLSQPKPQQAFQDVNTLAHNRETCAGLDYLPSIILHVSKGGTPSRLTGFCWHDHGIDVAETTMARMHEDELMLQSLMSVFISNCSYRVRGPGYRPQSLVQTYSLQSLLQLRHGITTGIMQQLETLHGFVETGCTVKEKPATFLSRHHVLFRKCEQQR